MHLFRMPSLGADMESGTVVEWHVAAGDAVARGQVVCTVETDKGAIEVECWEDGTVAALLVPAGTKLPVGAPLMALAQAGESVESVAQQAVAAAATGSAAAAAPAPAQVRASPAARRRAEELGVDLARVPAAAPGAPLTVADVERAAAARGTPAAGAEAATPAMRRAIAAAMSRSKREIPHYYLATEIVVERALQWLERRNADLPVAQRVLFVALALRATALALRSSPDLNGHFVDGAFRPGAGIHVGVAVALRGGGLVAPALHDADTLPLDALMARLADLLARARANQLRGAEMTDATITVTSLGELGVDTVLGVINPPQVALVGLGRVATRPCVVDGQVVAARVVHATLAADHRVSDGMRGARFLAELDRLLQSPEALA